MFRISVLATLLLVILVSLAGAQDKTPYKFMFGGNSYYGSRNSTVPWLAARFDGAIAGVGDWPGLHDSLMDAAEAMGKNFWAGPYASSQEINLYSRFNPGAQYNDRLADVKTYWQYVYAKHYLDSIGVSPESLVVHISDDYVSITNDGDGSRAYSLSGLPLPKRRFSYQYWNNTASDTMFYPAGYCWLANGYNRDARNALAYAYRRHILEDSATNGPGDHHWNAFFMDNQYREGYAPRLYSYYDINSTTGGPTSGLDWYEQPGIGNDVSANTHYYDYSTMLIDSTIEAVLDSACAANGLDKIHSFANVDKFSPVTLGVQLRHTNVALENPVDYLKAWPNGWQQWYAMADTMAAHPDRYVCWLFLGDFLCSSNPSDWKYDSSRIYMTHYAFFLQVRDTNAFIAPFRFNDTTRWRDIYYVDLGEPDGRAYEVSSVGSSYSKVAVMRRDYNNGAAAVLVRTSNGSVDWVNDNVPVNMHDLYYEIDANADTSATADSIFYMKPYMGKILIVASACGAPPSTPAAASPAPGSSVGTTPTLCVGNSSHGSCTDPVTYQFQISTDDAFASIVRESGWISEGGSTTCFTTSAPLDEGRPYFWRCRATNGTATSRWSDGSMFMTPNDPPPTPTGDSPADQGTVEALQPVLTVNNVTDPNGTPVSYIFQVSKFSNFSSLAAQSSAIPEGSGTTSWQVSPALENGSAYFWRARAYDGIASSGWMTSRSFTVDVAITNNPPTAPTVYSPPNGATVTFVPLSLSWYNSTDADGNPITYHLELYDSAAVTRLDSASGISQGSGATTSYSPQATLTNAEWYSWRVRAFDGNDYSPWMTTVRFYLDTMYGVNQPPEIPQMVSPLDFDTLISLQVSLVAAQSFDPESDPLTYDFALYGDADMQLLVDSASGLTPFGTGDNIIWPVTTTLISGARYYWTCRASDGENYSPWAAARTFWAFDFSVNTDQMAPENVYPIDGVVIKKTRPTLEVDNVVSTLDENLYYFEVSTDSMFTNRIYSGPVDENPNGRTSWEVTNPLESGRVYWWRSRANSSPYSEVESFLVDADVYMAPNPFIPGKGHSLVTIYNMAAGGVLTITDLNNQVVRIIEGNSSGLVTWDVTNDNGKELVSDVYLCYYKDHDRVDKFKFAVIR